MVRAVNDSFKAKSQMHVQGKLSFSLVVRRIKVGRGREEGT
jgi:hypothetical protein